MIIKGTILKRGEVLPDGDIIAKDCKIDISTFKERLVDINYGGKSSPHAFLGEITNVEDDGEKVDVEIKLFEHNTGFSGRIKDMEEKNGVKIVKDFELLSASILYPGVRQLGFSIEKEDIKPPIPPKDQIGPCA